MEVMKRYSFILLVFISLNYFGCNSPEPTPLSADSVENNLMEIEVLSQNPNESEILTGYDSTGYTPNIPNNNSFIFLSKNIINEGSLSFEHEYSTSVFFIKDSSIFSSSGKFLGHKTFDVGMVRINNVTAHKLPFVYRYRENGLLKDTVAGYQFVLNRRKGRPFQDPLNFEFNSNASIEIRRFGNVFNSEILMPIQTTGAASYETIRDKKNLKLSWTSIQDGSIDIVIGGYTISTQTPIPFYRIKVLDTGVVRIPPELIASIPKDRFNKLLISFIRRNVNPQAIDSFRFNIIAQSMYTLVLEMP